MKGILDFSFLAVSYFLRGDFGFIPYDEEQTIEKGEDVYDNSEAYELQLAPYFRLDARIGYKISGTRVSHEIGVDFTNLTNRPNEFDQYYDASAKQLKTNYQQGFFLYAFYRIRF